MIGLIVKFPSLVDHSIRPGLFFKSAIIQKSGLFNVFINHFKMLSVFLELSLNPASWCLNCKFPHFYQNNQITIEIIGNVYNIYGLNRVDLCEYRKMVPRAYVKTYFVYHLVPKDKYGKIILKGGARNIPCVKRWENMTIFFPR